MNEACQSVIFEHPLNERTRSWLRIETSLQQMHTLAPLDSLPASLAFFRAAAEFIEVTDRGEVRSEILKELEKQQKKLMKWAEAPNADPALIQGLSDDLKQQSAALSSAPRIAQHLKDDKIIAIVRQRLSIPGGCCGFDLPYLHLWLNLSQDVRNTTLSGWLEGLQPLKNALGSLLTLLRQSARFNAVESHNGFYQDNAEGADLLRLRLPVDYLIYPQVSGHKSRFAIRFLHMDSEHGIIPAQLPFEIACC